MTVATKPRRAHARSKSAVDPSIGLKIRELRTSRGMTQAALAGNDFTKGFISLIETGRTRISLRTAHIFAGRLGVEVTDLLAAPSADRQDLEFMLLRAEQALRAGHIDVTVEIAAKWTKKATGVLRARFQRLQARALIATTRSVEAVKLLDEALRAFRSLGAREFVARTLYDMARAQARLDAPGEAINYALQAEQAIARGDVVDRTLELEIDQFLVGAYYGLGDTASALTRGERARAIAEDVADPAGLAEMYQGLALTRYEEGDKEAALAYARKSIELWEQLGQRERLAETWNTLGWLFAKREQYGKAVEALDRSEQLARENGLQRLIPWITANRAGVALARGQHDEARKLAEAAASDGTSSTLRARAELLRARALAAGNAPLPQLRRAFEEAINAHAGESQRERARAHRAFADALAQRKQTADAYTQARQALDLVGPKV